MLPRVSAGVFIVDGQDPETLNWPKSAETPAELQSIAAVAGQQQAPVIVNKDNIGTLLVAHPVKIQQQHFGVLCLSMATSGKQQNIVIQLIDWSCLWLELILQANDDSDTQPDSNDDALALVQKMLHGSSLHEATHNFVTALAERYGCRRVSLGTIGKHGMLINAMSYQVEFDPRLNLVSQMQSAMEEALHGGVTVTCAPSAPAQTALIAHELLAKNSHHQMLCSVPLYAEDKPVGALLLQREKIFSELDKTQLTYLGRVLGPILALRINNQPGWLTKRLQPINEKLQSLFMPGAAMTKMSIMAIFLVVVALTFLNGEYEVTAEAILESEMQHAIVAPFDGYISTATARAGDTVVEGQILGRMDDRDIQFELQKTGYEKDDLTRQYRRALADMNQSETRIASARVAQVDAQWSLLNRRLAQVELRSPLTGIILAGDLSRSEGSPVTKGDLLFEVAPLASYRIVLHVNEKDIDELKPGQTGKVVLTSHPDREIPFVVSSISGVLTSEIDLGVAFRVEGDLQGDYELLRPGMEGIGRVSIEPRPLGWLLFHDIFDWLRLLAWRWLP